MERSKKSPSGKIGNAIMIAASALTLGACGDNQTSQRLKELEKKNTDQAAIISKMREEQHMIRQGIQNIKDVLTEPRKQASVTAPTPVVPPKSGTETTPPAKPTHSTDSHEACLTGLARERKTNEFQTSRLDEHDKALKGLDRERKTNEVQANRLDNHERLLNNLAARLQAVSRSE